MEQQGDKKAFYAYEHNGLKRFIGYEGMHFSLLRNKSGHIERIAQGGLNTTMEFDERGTDKMLYKAKESGRKNVTSYTPSQRL